VPSVVVIVPMRCLRWSGVVPERPYWQGNRLFDGTPGHPAGAEVNARDRRVSDDRGHTGQIPGERGYDKNQPRRLP
jgi:hypothetical protein